MGHSGFGQEERCFHSEVSTICARRRGHSGVVQEETCLHSDANLYDTVEETV